MRNPSGPRPMTPPMIPTNKTSRKAAPMRSQKPALGNASVSGKVGAGPGGVIVGGASVGLEPAIPAPGSGIGPEPGGAIGGTGATGDGGGGAGLSGISRLRLPNVAVTAAPKP